MIGYLKFKPTVRLALKGDELFGNAGTLNVWVDAAHAVHKPSMRSHIGVFASAGRGSTIYIMLEVTLVLMMGIEGESVEKSRKRRRTVKL